MMAKNNNQIIIVVLIIIAAVFILPKLNLFSIVPYADQCILESCPAGYSQININCDDSSSVCTRYCQQVVTPSCGTFGSYSNVKTKTVNEPTEGTYYSTDDYPFESNKCYYTYAKTVVDIQGVSADPTGELRIYADTDESSIGDETFPCTGGSCVEETTSDEELVMGSSGHSSARGKFTTYDTWSYDYGWMMWVKLYVREATYNPGGTYDSNKQCSYASCIESDVILVGGVYKICHNSVYTAITDVILLTPAEQAAVIAQINALNATIQQKAEIIQNLTDNLAGQALLIDQLQNSTAEKAILIEQLSSNITYQAGLISAMQLTSAQQVATIEALSSNITYQGELIAQLNTNLNNKIILIGQLQVENANQAQLIAAMNLSFENQAYIIQQLSNNITDDAVIINNLHLSIQDQASLINQLTLQRDELAALVAALNLSNGDVATLLNSLNLEISDQVAIIAQLNLSLQEEQDLVNQLRLTIDEQNEIINNLRNGTTPTSTLGDKISDWFSDLTPTKIGIIAGGVFVLLLLLRRKK